MRVLALDTSTRSGSIAILDGARVRAAVIGDASRPHAERCPLDVLRALRAAELTPSAIDLWAVASGPGMFTGLRIGIATVQGFAMANGARVAPVSALLALAESRRSSVAPGDHVGAWMDAHRSDVFSALYRVESTDPDRIGALVEIEAPSVEPPQSVWSRWTEAGHIPRALAGDGAQMYAHVSGLPVGEPPPLAPFIARLATARAEAGESLGPAAIQPLYVRRTDAEVMREAREKVRS